VAAADALAGEFAVDDLDAMARAASRAAVPLPRVIERAQGLAARGVSTGVSRTAVEALASRGRGAFEAMDLGRAVERMSLREGIRAEDAARLLAEELKRGATGAEAERKASARAREAMGGGAATMGPQSVCPHEGGPSTDAQFGKHPMKMMGQDGMQDMMKKNGCKMPH
jgi:hypothetical protein